MHPILIISEQLPSDLELAELKAKYGEGMEILIPEQAKERGIKSLDDLMQPREKDPMELIENIKRDAEENKLKQIEYIDQFPRHNHERPKYFTKKSKFNKKRK